jgi:hypothetical protein
MKIKILILLIILSSFFGYLECGKDSKMFLSTLPFIILSVMRISLYKKDKKKAEVDL